MAFDLNKGMDEEKLSSRINAAGLINSTLEKLWNECYTAMADGQYSIWNVKLDSIWAILGGDEDEGGEKDKAIKSLTLKIYNAGSLKSQIGKGFKKEQNPNNALQYHLLLKKSLFLRRLQNEQGKGTAYTKDDDDDFD